MRCMMFMTEVKNIYCIFPKHAARERIGSLEINDEQIDLLLSSQKSLPVLKRATSNSDKSNGNLKSNYNLKYAIDSREIEIETLELTEIQGNFYIILLSFNRESNTNFISLASATSFEILFYKEKVKKITNIRAKGDVLVIEYNGRVVSYLISVYD
jgi:hypothetical protein